MKLTITHNFPEVQKALDNLREDVRAKALASAVNKSMDQAKTQMVRGISNEYAVTARYVRDRLRVNRATFKAGQFGIEASLVGGNGKKRSANVINFSAKKTGKGVTVKILRAGPRKLIRTAFIANQGRTVFERVGKSRLPIRAVQTIDVPQMFNQRRINDAVVRALTEKFPGVFANEARFYTERFNSGRAR